MTLHRLADELRTARAVAGLSLRDVAAAAGVSRSQLARLETGRAPEESLRTLSIVFAVLGMRLSARPYPEGAPIRDAAHARLLARFRAELPATIKLRTEVPLRQRPDLRTWDAQLETDLLFCKLEADTVLYDVQAQERRIAQKMADDATDLRDPGSCLTRSATGASCGSSVSFWQSASRSKRGRSCGSCAQVASRKGVASRCSDPSMVASDGHLGGASCGKDVKSAPASRTVTLDTGGPDSAPPGLRHTARL